MRFVPIVRAAPELQILRGRGAAIGKWPHVMKLEESRLGASTVRPDERAPARVARPYMSLYCSGHSPGPRARSTALARARRPRKLRPFEFSDQVRQRAVDDGSRI